MRVGLGLWTATAMTLSTLFVLAGCGAPRSAEPAEPVAPSPAASSAPSNRPPSSPSPPVSPSTQSAAPTSAGSGASLGVEKVRWPDEFPAVGDLVRRLPKSLLGQDRKIVIDAKGDGDGGPGANVSYSADSLLNVGLEYEADDDGSGKPGTWTAGAELSSSFGLGAACKQGAYEGTIPSWPDFDGPAVAKTSESVQWFACPVQGAEGDENFVAHAVGWTRGKGAWLVFCPDEAAAKTLVSALIEAAR